MPSRPMTEADIEQMPIDRTAKNRLIEFVRNRHSPEDCGCKQRKDAVVDWLENGTNPFPAILRSLPKIIHPSHQSKE